MDFSTGSMHRIVEGHLTAIFKTKPDILNFLLKHPLRDKLESSLLREIQICDKRKMMQAGVDGVNNATKDVVKFWAGQILDHHARSMMSDNEKRRIQDLGRREEIARDTVHGIVKNLDEDDFDLQEI